MFQELEEEFVSNLNDINERTEKLMASGCKPILS